MIYNNYIILCGALKTNDSFFFFEKPLSSLRPYLTTTPLPPQKKNKKEKTNADLVSPKRYNVGSIDTHSSDYIYPHTSHQHKYIGIGTW